MRRAVGFMLVGVAVAVLAGCGASGKSNSAATSAPAAKKGPTTTARTTTRSPAKQAKGRLAARYERQMQVLGRQLSTYFAMIGRADTTASKKQLVVDAKNVQARLRDASVKLGEMKPPAEIRADHQKLIAAVREYASELDGIIAELKNGNRSVLATIPRLQGIQDMTKATRLITRAGYDIIGRVPPSG